MMVGMRLPLLLALVPGVLAVPLLSAPPSLAAVDCQGETATVVGTPGTTAPGTDGPDVIVTNGANRVEAGDGADLVCVTTPAAARRARVTVVAGPGADSVEVRSAPDDYVVTYLGLGEDTYVGRPGHTDIVYGAGADPGDPEPPDTERDVIDTGGGYQDTVTVGANGVLLEDVVDLGRGENRLYLRGTGLADNGSLSGGGTGSRLDLGPRSGTWTVDNVEGVATNGAARFEMTGFTRFPFIGDEMHFRGNDAAETVLVGGPGSWSTGRGDDVIGLSGPVADASISGGRGVERITFSTRRTGGLGSADGDVALDLAAGTLRLEGRGPIRVAGIDQWSFTAGGQAVVRGSAGPDHVTAQACRLTMYGGAGSDTLTADVTGGFGETGCSGATTSRLVGGSSGDTLIGYEDDAVVLGGDGADRILMSSYDSEAYGQDGNDVLRAVGTDPVGRLFNGGNDADLVVGGGGGDTIVGGPGPDRLYGSAGRDTANGGTGSDLCRAEVRRACER